jgi:hypothetical protein
MEKERQELYLKVGNRVIGALLSEKLTLSEIREILCGVIYSMESVVMKGRK